MKSQVDGPGAGLDNLLMSMSKSSSKLMIKIYNSCQFCQNVKSLKGQSHQIGDSCVWVRWMKFLFYCKRCDI
jgi:hypothetical protein